MRRTTLLLVAALLLVTTACGQWREADPWPDVDQDTFVITTGNPAGIYAVYGTALGATVADRSGLPVEVLESGGSIENLERLGSHRADLAFTAADAAADAAAGRGAFEEPLPIRALARIYDDFVHLVVPADSPIESVADLPGRTVAIGAPGSGTALIAERVIQAAGHELDQLDTESLTLEASLAAMQDGEVEALFWSGGLSTPALSEFAEHRPIRVIPMADLVEPMRSVWGSYRAGTVPAGIYGLTEDVPTLAVPNLLVVRSSTPDELVRAQVATLFDVRDEITEMAPAAAVLDRSSAIFTDPVELHPGAIEYYRDTAQ